MQLYVFNRNNAVYEIVREPVILKLIMERLYENDADGAIEAIKMAYNSVEDDKERENIQSLLTFFTNNIERLIQYSRRGIDISPVNGVLKPAKQGVMESNVFSLIGNRMKAEENAGP